MEDVTPVKLSHGPSPAHESPPNIASMKTSIFLALAVALVPAASFAQTLPEAPPPAPTQSTSNSLPPALISDAAWRRIQQIVNGKEVLVSNTYGPPLRCQFAGATDGYLFCDPPNSPAGTGYRFERASVIDVKVVKEPINWHPGLLSAMIAGGMVVGIVAATKTDAGHAAVAGLVGALVAGAIATPEVFLQPQPMFAGVGAGVVIHPHGFHRRAGFPIRPRPGLPKSR